MLLARGPSSTPPGRQCGALATLARQGICAAAVDWASVRQANLYSETPPHLYAVTLRARERPKRRLSMLDAWFHPLALGLPLPAVPLWLAPSLRVMPPLATSYQEACRVLGIA